MHKNKLLTIIFTIVILSNLPSMSLAGDPYLAKYRDGGCQIFWFVQISDTHLDTLPEHSERLYWALTELLNTINPVFLTTTGDLVDASEGFTVNGQTVPINAPSEAEWTQYQKTVDSANLQAGSYIDVVGNHDHYNNEGNTYYLTYSFIGRQTNRLQQSILLTFPFGSYHFFFADTTANDDKNFPYDCVEMGIDELNELEGEINRYSTASLSFILAHHPYYGILNSDFCPGDDGRNRGYQRYVELINLAQAFYFHGHEHWNDIYISEGILSFEVNSWGKDDIESTFAIYAIDNDAISVSMNTINDPWPSIVITAPSTIQYPFEIQNPYYYSVENGCNQSPVRALVFDNKPVTSVQFKIDSNQWITMQKHPVTPNLYSGYFDASIFQPGNHTLTVQANGSQLKETSITINIITQECTLENEEYNCAGDGDSDSDGDGDLDVDYDNEEDIQNDVSIDVYLDQGTDESFDNINEDLSFEDVDLEDNKNKSSGCGCHIATAE